MHVNKTGCVIAVLALLASSVGSSKAQTAPIHAQDPMEKGSDQGPSGWVQAPIPRGLNPNQKAAQGAPAAGQKAVAVGGGNARGQAPDKAGQVDSGDNPGTPMANPLPGPSGTAPNRD